MSKAADAIQLMIEDCSNARREIDEGHPSRSFLQRTRKTVEDLDEIFDPSDDENAIALCRTRHNPGPEYRMLRQRVAFLRGSLKEFHEDLGGASDVDMMRLMSVPFLDAEFPFRLALEEMEAEQK